MKSNYKTNCRTLGKNCETNLMRYINPQLVDGCCRTTIANYELVWLVRFFSRISTRLCKKIYKQILFDTPKWYDFF